jgi:hypothetical protein
MGPRVTSVSSPGRRRASSTIRSGPNRAESGRLGGGRTAYPIPRGPCVSGVVTRLRTSGISRPSATSTSARPASSSTARVFSATCRASTLPATQVTATISASGEAHA